MLILRSQKIKYYGWWTWKTLHFENILVEQGFILDVSGEAKPLSDDQKKEQKQNKDAKQEQLFNEWLESSDRESKSAFTLFNNNVK